MVLIGWDRKNKKIEIVPPKTQSVTAASIKYTMEKLPGISIIGSIHSHASMSAFHSGVDIKDEIDFDGLHITLGKFNGKDDSFEISSQLTSGNAREDINYNDIIEGINTTYSCEVKFDNMKTTTYEEMIKQLKEDPSHEAKFHSKLSIEPVHITAEMHSIIDKWLSTIEEKKYNYYNNKFESNKFNQYPSLNPLNTNKNNKKQNLNMCIDENDLTEENLCELYGIDDPDDLTIDEYYRSIV
jgi:hypothetical protein